MTSADPGEAAVVDGALDEALTRDLEQAERERGRLQVGAALDLQALTDAIERLERELARRGAQGAAPQAATLIALLDELGQLVHEIVSAREAAGTQLRTDRRHREAGLAYRRTGHA